MCGGLLTPGTGRGRLIARDGARLGSGLFRRRSVLPGSRRWVARRCWENPRRALAGECLGVVVGELPDVCGWLAGDLGDRGGDCCFPAPVVCVVLQQALDLPWRQDALQAGGEGFGRYAGEGDVAAERGAQRCGDLCVGDGGWTAAVRLRAHHGPHRCPVADQGVQDGPSGVAGGSGQRDELLTELVIDAYHDLADALADAVGQVPSSQAPAQLEALARSYRAWALAQPYRYRLLFGPPLPGYDAHAQRLVEAAQQAMNVLAGVLPGLGQTTQAPPGQPLASQLSAWARAHGLGIDPATVLQAVLIWSRLHGFVRLEIAGNFASMGIDPDRLFGIQLAALTR
jgi:Tetracyclin repressor-like, C-terminal domain